MLRQEEKKPETEIYDIPGPNPKAKLNKFLLV